MSARSRCGDEAFALDELVKSVESTEVGVLDVARSCSSERQSDEE